MGPFTRKTSWVQVLWVESEHANPITWTLEVHANHARIVGTSIGSPMGILTSKKMRDLVGDDDTHHTIPRARRPATCAPGDGNAPAYSIAT